MRLRLGWFVLLLACRDEPRPQLDLGREHDSAITYAGVSFSTVFERGADEQAPLVVMLHGRGDTARAFREAWPALPLKLQLSFPQAPLPYGGGRQWFETRADPAGYAEVVGAAEARLWPAIVELAHGRRLIIGGFSQGAAVAYAIAARHPDQVIAAFLIGGRIPALRGEAPLPPILALHGTADDRIAIDVARAGIATLRAAGVDATLLEYPGVGHTIAPAMIEELVARVRELTSPPASRSPRSAGE